jgi:hypothetical protein
LPVTFIRQNPQSSKRPALASPHSPPADARPSAPSSKAASKSAMNAPRLKRHIGSMAARSHRAKYRVAPRVARVRYAAGCARQRRGGMEEQFPGPCETRPAGVVHCGVYNLLVGQHMGTILSTGGHAADPPSRCVSRAAARRAPSRRAAAVLEALAFVWVREDRSAVSSSMLPLCVCVCRGGGAAGWR